jgi:hypothetical protein
VTTAEDRDQRADLAWGTIPHVVRAGAEHLGAETTAADGGAPR